MTSVECTRSLLPVTIRVLVASILVSCLQPRSLRAEVVYKKIVVTEEQAPGLAAGVAFHDLGGVPGIGDDFPPRIDANGRVVFHAFLSGPGITGGAIDNGNGLSVWRADDAGPILVARQDDPAPGTPPGVEFVGFPFPLFTSTPLIDGGAITIHGGLRGPGIDNQSFSNAFGFWSTRSGSLDLVFRNGEQAPGLPPGFVFSMFSLPGTTSTGRITVNTGWRAPGQSAGSSFPDQEGFWSDRSGPLLPLLKGGDQAPGKPAGVVFGMGGQFAIEGAFRVWDANASQLVANGNLRGPGIDDLNDEGIWKETGTGFVLLAAEGEVAPDAGPPVHFGARNGIDCFSDGVALRINAAGHVMFGARLSGGSVGFMRSIYTDRSGTLRLVVRGTLPVTNATPGDPAPGLAPGHTFSAMNLAGIDDDGRIAFTGAATFNMIFENQVEGIWWDRPGPLSLVVQEGDPVPGAGPGVFFDGLNNFLSVGAAGHLAFIAGFRGPGVDSSNFQGFLLVDLDGTLHLLARNGTLFDVDGDGSDMRMISSILGGNVNPAGEVPFELRFTDGSSGIFTARVADTSDISLRPPLYQLGSSFPNPMRAGGEVSIPLRLASAARVRLRVHDVRGRLVATLVDQSLPAGDHLVPWDGTTYRGARAPNGIYYLDCSAGGEKASSRLVVAR